MPKSIDQIFGSTSSKPKTIDEIFAPSVQPADPNVNMGNFRQLDQQSLPPNLTIGPTQRNLNLLQNPALQMFTESQKLPVEDIQPAWGLGKLQQNDPLQKLIDNSPVGSFFNRWSQQGNNIAYNGGENIPGQTLSDTGNATANKIADMLGYTGLFMNPAAGVQKIGAAFASKGLSKVAPKLGATGNSLLSNAAGQAAFGAGFGAQEAAAKSQENPDYTLGQGLKDVGLNALYFGGGDLALRGLGTGAKTLLNKSVGKAEGVINDFAKPSLKTDIQPLDMKPKVVKFPQPESIAPLDPQIGTPLPTASQKIISGNLAPDILNDPLSIESKQTIPATITHISSKTKRDAMGVPDAINEGYIKTVDNLHRIKQFDNAVESVTGEKLSPSDSAYMLGLNSRGSDIISKQILTDKLVNPQGEVVGNSLKDITKQIPKGKVKEFEDYLINKHAITRMDRGEKVFPDSMQMTPEKSAQIVANYESKYPQFKQISDEYYNFNNQLGKSWLVDTGIISPEQWQAYLETNPNYVPMNRHFDAIEKNSFTGPKKGFANQSNPVKKATGSQRPIISPLESTIEHVDKYVKVAKRNEVMQTLIRNLQRDPEAFSGWAELVPAQSSMNKNVVNEINKTLETEGIDGALSKLSESLDAAFNAEKVRGSKTGNEVTGLVNGQPVKVKVNDPQLLEALTNLTPKGQNFVIEALGQLTRTMKVLTTGVNPVFSLTRNIFRDVPTAFINSKTTNNPLVFGKDLLGSLVSVMRNDELYKSFKNIGGGHSSSVASNRNLLAQSKEAILPQQGLLKPLAKKGFHALENLNNAIETAPRLGEFKRLTKNSTYDNKVKGLFEANDVTVNFNKYGNWAKEADSVIPYLNAAIQGLDKFGRVYKDNPVQAVAKSFLAVSVPSIMLYTINHDNPNYQGLSNYIKDNNFLIPKNDGTFIKIPKPRETGALFGSSVERLLRQWQDQDPEAFKGFVNSVWQAFAPPMRTILHPAVVDITANKDYSGAPIVPGDLQKLSPQNQYDSRTSEIAKGIGGLFNQSPKQIDYLIKSYGGVLGELGLPATTKDVSIGETLKRKVTADPVFSNDIMNEFYDRKNKLDTAYSDFKQTGEKTSDYNDTLRKSYNNAADEISKLRKQQKDIQTNSNLAPEQQLEKVRQLQLLMNQRAKQANQMK